MKQLRASFFISLAILFTANFAVFATPPQYSLTDLGAGYAYSINSNGQVAGIVGDAAYLAGNATLFDTTGQGNNITLGSGGALSINNSGQAVGGRLKPPSAYEAMNYKRNPNGTYTAEAMGDWAAYAINNNGQMVGMGSGGLHSGAVIFTYNESLHTYQKTLVNGPLGGGIAFSNNDNGQIVGSVNSAVVWNPNGSGGYTSTGLGTLSGYSQSEAKSINNNGLIVGDAYASGGYGFHARAALFDQTGGNQNIYLGSLSGYTYSWAKSINDSGQIVGTSFNECGASGLAVSGLATLFDPTGAGNNINLNTTLVNPLSGWTLREAMSINENGWIVGYMTKTGTGDHAFLLTPVPEPATLILMVFAAPFLLRRGTK